MKKWADLRCVLGNAWMYKTYQTIVGGRKARRRYIEDFVSPQSGDKILDIGCGAGDILDFLPEVDYHGIDVDAAYIAAARRNYGDRSSFSCQTVGNFDVPDAGTFSIVLAAGVLHHLCDEDSRKLFEASAKALKPGGRLVTLDGCFMQGQHCIARWLLDADRGKFVRKPAEYEALASLTFRHITCYVVERLFYVPYTVLIMECCKEVDTIG